MHHLTPSHPHRATRTVTLPPSCTTLLLTLSYKHQIRSHLHPYPAHTNTHAAHIPHSHTCANTHARTCTHTHPCTRAHNTHTHTHTHTHTLHPTHTTPTHTTHSWRQGQRICRGLFQAYHGRDWHTCSVAISAQDWSKVQER